MRGRPHGRAVGPLALERHLHGAEALHVGAGEDGSHTGSGGRGGRVDRTDSRMGMGGPDDHHMRLAGLVDVVVEAAFTAEETDVLEALHRLPDTELPHPIRLLWRASDAPARAILTLTAGMALAIVTPSTALGRGP